MFTQSQANCALIKEAQGVDRCMLECWALTMANTLPHAEKTTNIPEGTAITHSAVSLMTAEGSYHLCSQLSGRQGHLWLMQIEQDVAAD